MPSTSSSPASSTSTTSSSTVSEGSGEEPGPVEKKGDQFAAIITVGTSTTKQAETTVDEGSGEVEASGQEDTTTTQQYAPEGSGATVDASNGYDQPELLLPDHFTSETTPIITIATTKKASGWKPFVFDCAKEEDDRGMLCQDWADSGLCERHKPTQFLFCRKTCLCTGPPNRRKRIN
ncbi:unnamed protein product, partial [Mesorhabditis spiculigera]